MVRLVKPCPDQYFNLLHNYTVLLHDNNYSEHNPSEFCPWPLAVTLVTNVVPRKSYN